MRRPRVHHGGDHRDGHRRQSPPATPDPGVYFWRVAGTGRRGRPCPRRRAEFVVVVGMGVRRRSSSWAPSTPTATATPTSSSASPGNRAVPRREHRVVLHRVHHASGGVNWRRGGRRGRRSTVTATRRGGRLCRPRGPSTPTTAASRASPARSPRRSLALTGAITRFGAAGDGRGRRQRRRLRRYRGRRARRAYLAARSGLATSRPPPPSPTPTGHQLAARRVRATNGRVRGSSRSAIDAGIAVRRVVRRRERATSTTTPTGGLQRADRGVHQLFHAVAGAGDVNGDGYPTSSSVPLHRDGGLRLPRQLGAASPSTPN